MVTGRIISGVTRIKPQWSAYGKRLPATALRDESANDDTGVMPKMSSCRSYFRGRKYAAFLFDMDGTLLDSSAVVERVWRAWATRHGIDPAELMASVHGVRSEDTIRRFAPDGIDVAAEAKLLLEAEVADLEGVVPIAGIEAFIASLDPNSWAVVTSAPRSLAEVRLRAAGLSVPKTLIAAEDVQRGKPEPEGFLKAAKLLGVPIGECLVFEDSPAGVAAAKSAGAHVAIVGDLVPAEEGMLSIVNYLPYE
jgi:mannitol-1-/sugar-/sorbitol-6-phosphatase